MNGEESPIETIAHDESRSSASRSVARSITLRRAVVHGTPRTFVMSLRDVVVADEYLVAAEPQAQHDGDGRQLGSVSLRVLHRSPCPAVTI